MLDAQFRASLDRVTRPVASRLAAWGVKPDQLTVAGLVFAGGAAFAIARGALLLGAALALAAGLPDLLDGAVARRTGSCTKRGQFFDSVADRVSDALLFGGVAVHLLARHQPGSAGIAVAAMAAAMLISYERAKAESLGFGAKGGLMERGERVGALVVALAVPGLLVPGLWVILSLSLLTVLQRFVLVWRQGTQEMATVAPAVPTGLGQPPGRADEVHGAAAEPGRSGPSWRERLGRLERSGASRRSHGVPRSWYRGTSERGSGLWSGAWRNSERRTALFQREATRSRRRRKSWRGSGKLDWPSSRGG